MVDIVDKATRSRMMSHIRGKNTKPELIIRKGLFGKGFRYRLHQKKLPGKPDLVFPKYRAVIFVNGCFWHGHDCKLFKWPLSNKRFWRVKITGNQKKDARNIADLKKSGWRVLIIWECSMRNHSSVSVDRVINNACKWILSTSKLREIPTAQTR